MCRRLFLLACFTVVLSIACIDTAFGVVWEGRIASSTDDREHYVGGGLESATSSDLEMPYENTGKADPQTIGIRFINVEIPKGANITSAYVEFVCDETKGGTELVSVIINGQTDPNPISFTDDIINRPRTTAGVVWEPENWTSAGQVSQTSDISSVIQEIVNQDGWASGNALALIISDNPDNPSQGIRCAESYDGTQSQAALLHIEYSSNYALNPSPSDSSLYENTWASLSWEPGDTSVSHDVYMSESFDDVNDRAPAAFTGSLSVPFSTVGFPGFPFPDGLAPGTTYYWAVDEVEGDGTTKYQGPVWSFTIPSKAAYNPSPRDGAKAIDPDGPQLSWSPGFGAKLHAVYFGDDFDTVSNATGASPLGASTYNPGSLEKDKVYYWRVDELNPPDTVKGNVWSFRTLPEIVITDPDMIGWWKLDNAFGTTVLDWSGYGNDGTLGGDPQLVDGIFDMGMEFDGSDYIAIDGVVDDITSTNISLSIWIKTTQTGWGDLIAANDSASAHPLEFVISGGYPGLYDGSDTNFPNAPIVADDQWHMMTYVREGNTARIYVDGVEAVTDPASFDLSTVTRWSIGQEWDDSTPSNFYTGLVDDVRFFNKALTADEVAELMRGDPLVAWNPKPADGRIIDVEQGNNPLAWSPGDNASQHDVYLGMDKDALELADTSTADIYRGRQSGTSYSPPEGLPWGTGPYYWRIDEINTDGSVSAGSIWSFSVADYLIVEDFDSYTDNDPDNEAIWQHWIDGYGIPSNGAQVGYLFPPYAEKTIVRSGQSMPLAYQNTNGVTNSEALLTLTAPRDWTTQGVDALSIWFRGYPASVGSFTESPAGTFTMTGSGADIWNTADEFHFAYKMLNGAGTIIVRVDSVTNTDPWAKAGVMIRETLDPGSPHAFVCVTPGQGVSFQRRYDADGSSVSDTEANITAPHWVKLERDVAGNFTASHSTNGSTWVPVAGAIPDRILINTSVYVGLALTAHNAGATCEAKLSNVSTTGNVTGQWTSQDIGIASNAAEPLYVSVANATGAPAVVAHSDPAAATINTWTEWVIPLQDFVDKGINPTNIDKIAVGLGSQSGVAASGGSGTVFFDDFRLYRLAQ